MVFMDVFIRLRSTQKYLTGNGFDKPAQNNHKSEKYRYNYLYFE